MDYSAILIALSAATLSGFATALVAAIKDNKKEEIRQREREQDLLKFEIKDHRISLYQLERDLTDWKDKYYRAIQDIIAVKSELEHALIQLNLVDLEGLDPEIKK